MSSLEGPTIFHKPHADLTEEEKRQAEETTNEAIVEILKKLLQDID